MSSKEHILGIDSSLPSQHLLLPLHTLPPPCLQLHRFNQPHYFNYSFLLSFRNKMKAIIYNAFCLFVSALYSDWTLVKLMWNKLICNNATTCCKQVLSSLTLVPL